MARTGHAEAHAGERQCMHCFFANRLSTPSTRFTTVNWNSVVSRRLLSTSSPSAGGGLPLASAHAASHPRQPTHRVVSTSMPGESLDTGSVLAAAPAPDATAAPAAHVPAPTPTTFKNPLRPSFMSVSPPTVLRASCDQVERANHGDCDQGQCEREHHGVPPFEVPGRAFGSSSFSERPARVSASRYKLQAQNASLSQVLAVGIR